ncbi:MAG: peptidoglycan DD-metalloendopeptidase family protein [Myxococcales bacterium]
MAGPVRNPAEAFQQLEAIMLRQMLQSSGAFKAGSTPGAQLRTDMFVETLADAVAKAGGLGIAKMLQHQLGGGAPEAATPAPAHGGAPSAPSAAPWPPGLAPHRAASGATLRHSLLSPSSVSGGQTAFPGRPDDLDDPNSEAPLLEDPTADSIDDYQKGGAAERRGLTDATFATVTHPGNPTDTVTHTGALEVTSEVTSGFGPRVHPITGDRRFHTGVDLRAPQGAPIRAAAGGVVLEAGSRGGYGNTVEIDHGNGTTTLYAHASAVLVDKGQRVEPGQPVALVGQTGQATGPHLHFEIRRNDHPVNPTSGAAPISIMRALNTYRKRAEVIGAGTPSSAGTGEKP